MNRSKVAVVAVDATDPDNLALLVAAFHLYYEVHLLLTGRPVNLLAKQTSDKTDKSWRLDDSQIMLQINAARFYKVAKICGRKLRVYNGGIAPHTLIPHFLHFDEREFGDLDGSDIRMLQLGIKVTDSIDGLIEHLKQTVKFDILVGGPMTGVAMLLQKEPELSKKINVMTAMYGVFDSASMMDLGGGDRGGKQFNVACDAPAGYSVLVDSQFPIYLIPTDCTKIPEISFDTVEELRSVLKNTAANQHLLKIYQVWYKAAVEPRKEKIILYDLCCLMAFEDVYSFQQMAITNFPHGEDKTEWGKLEFEPSDVSNLFVARKANTELYLRMLNKWLK